MVKHGQLTLGQPQKDKAQTSHRELDTSFTVLLNRSPVTQSRAFVSQPDRSLLVCTNPGEFPDLQ